MSIIQGGGAHNVDSADAVFDHLINQSLRFADDDNPSLTFSPSSSGNRKTWTLSLWVKRANIGNMTGQEIPIFSAGTSGTSWAIFFTADDELFIQSRSSSSNQFVQKTNGLFRDVSAWYHIVYAFDTTQATDTNRSKLYVNGEQITLIQHTSNTLYPSQNTDYHVNNSSLTHYIGYGATHNEYLDGYLAEVNFIDGAQYDASYFGETKDGVWIPKEYSGSYGTYGWHLDFADSSDIGNNANTTDGTNDWTVSGGGSPTLVATDVVPDSPTNNFATMNPLDQEQQGSNENQYRDGNLDVKSIGSSGRGKTRATFEIPTTGKWYWETMAENTTGMEFGILPSSEDLDNADQLGGFAGGYTYRSSDGNKKNSGTKSSYGNSYTNLDVLAALVDADAGEIFFYKNGTIQNSGTAAFTSLDMTKGFMPAWGDITTSGNGRMAFNFGQDSTFDGQKTAGNNTDANGRGDFLYTVPTGALALCSANLPDPTIGPGKDQIAEYYFETQLYTGDGGVQHIGSGGARHPQDTVTIAKSLRFEDSSLHRDITSSGNTRTWTWSAWVKRSSLGGSNGQYLFTDGKSSSLSSLNFDSSDRLYAQLRDTTAGASKYKLTNRTFKSLSTWYHIVWRVDTTQSTASDRSRLYINGTQITDWNTEQNVASASNETTINASGTDHLIGAYNTSSTSRHFDGYMAEVNFVDGQSYGPETFGQVGSNGYWIPKSLSGVSYGSSNNSFRLDFADSSALGDDESGNGNDFDITDNVGTHDQVTDSPTQNFAVLDSNYVNDRTQTFAEGNLDYSSTQTSTNPAVVSTFAVNTGKWYWEVYIRAQGNSANSVGIASKPNDLQDDSTAGYSKDWAFSYQKSGTARNNGDTSYGDAWSTGDIIGVALDLDAGTVKFYRNGTVQNSGTAAFTGLSSTEGFTSYSLVYNSGAQVYNFGQDDSFAGNKTSGTAGAADANGAGAFYYTPPSGHLALLDDNIPVEGINAPDWVWIKNRSTDNVSNVLQDSVRGMGANGVNFNSLITDSDTAEFEQTDADGVSSLDFQGFTVGYNDSTAFNKASETYVAWMWKAGGAPTVDNSAAADAAPTAGSVKIDGANKTDAFSGSPSAAVTRLSASTVAGFSIVTFAGSSSNVTLPHGLSSAPEFITVRRRNENSSNWFTYHKGAQSSGALVGYLNTPTNGYDFGASSTVFQDTQPTDNVFSLGNSNANKTGDTYVAYCFHSVEGYSRIGSYTGNGNADGTFVYTGFRPAWVLFKRSDGGNSQANGWFLMDTKRDTNNVMTEFLRPNTNDDEDTAANSIADFLSNGFKLRGTGGDVNTSNANYIYLAFAEAPFKFANAR